MGLVSVTLMVKVAAVCKPESNPPGELPDAAKYVQGFSTDDWVTEWGISFGK